MFFMKIIFYLLRAAITWKIIIATRRMIDLKIKISVGIVN